MSVCCPAVLLSAEWIVSCTRITCIQPLSRCSLTFLASSFFSESVVVLFFSLFLFFSTMRSFFLSFFLSLVYWPFRTRLLAYSSFKRIFQSEKYIDYQQKRCFRDSYVQFRLGLSPIRLYTECVTERMLSRVSYFVLCVKMKLRTNHV